MPRHWASTACLNAWACSASRSTARAIYGLASHGKVNGAFKPGNRSRDLKGLYLAGGAAHPGPGMPMVLMSGWIAADSLDTDMGGRGAAAGKATSAASVAAE